MDAQTQWAVEQIQRYLRAGNAAAVVELGEHLLARKNQDFETFRLAASCLALAYEKLGDGERSLYWFRQCLVMDPAQPALLAGCGRVLMKMGRHDEAATVFRHLTRRHPERADFHAAAGTVLLRLGELDGALRHLRLAYQLDPANPYVLNDLAGAYLLQGEFEAALSTYKQAVELIPPPDPEGTKQASPAQLDLARDISESIEEVRAALVLHQHAAGAPPSAQVTDLYPADPSDSTPQVSEKMADADQPDVASFLATSKVRSMVLDTLVERGCRPREILAALHLWSDFLETLPAREWPRVEKRAEAWAAAAVYAVGRLEGAAWALQADLAEQFHIPKTTLSRHYGQLRHALDIEDDDPRYNVASGQSLRSYPTMV